MSRKNTTTLSKRNNIAEHIEYREFIAVLYIIQNTLITLFNYGHE